MEVKYWQKQSVDQPLYRDIIWSRPINKKHQGKLQIIGGNIHGVSAPNFAYIEAVKQKIGSVKVYLPDKTAKLLPPKSTDIELLPSTTNGSLSQESLEVIKSNINQTDALLMAGDFAKNSETFILLEKIATLEGLQIYSKDSLDAFIRTPKIILDRPQTLVVTDFARLQKIVANSDFDKALTSKIELMQMVDLLREFSILHECILLTKLGTIYYVCYQGLVVTTDLQKDIDWAVLSSAASVWLLQHSQKPLEAVATSLTQVSI